METLSFGQQARVISGKLFQPNPKVSVTAVLVGLICIGAVAASVFLEPVFGSLLFHVGFFAAGYLYLQLLNDQQLELTQSESLILDLGWGALLMIVLTLVHFFAAQVNWLMIVAGVSAFLLPFTLQSARRFYQELAAPEIQPWYYHDSTDLQKSTTFLNSQEIRFRVRWPDRRDTVYLSFRAPVRMPIGLLFYHSAQQQKEEGSATIQLLNEAGQPYGWIFYATRFSKARRYLNPEAGITENAIGKNALITVQQVPVPWLLPTLPNGKAMPLAD